MNIVFILFGEMGAGKNYHGKKLQEENPNLEFLDGDDLIPEEMKEHVLAFKAIPKSMLDDYVQNHLAPAIATRARTCNLLVAQALYLDEHRLFIQKYLEKKDLHVQFFLVKAPFKQNLKQLLTRQNPYQWVKYWLLNKPFFEEPTHSYHKL